MTRFDCVGPQTMPKIPPMAGPFEMSELGLLVSACLLLASSLRFRVELRRVPHWRRLIGAFGFFTLAALATNLEHLGNFALFDGLEHLSYALQSSLLLSWGWAVTRRGPA